MTDLTKILEKLKSNDYPEGTYVGKNYTKADLIADIESVTNQLAQDKERLETVCKALLSATSIGQLKRIKVQIRNSLPGESDED